MHIYTYIYVKLIKIFSCQHFSMHYSMYVHFPVYCRGRIGGGTLPEIPCEQDAGLHNSVECFLRGINVNCLAGSGSGNHVDTRK